MQKVKKTPKVRLIIGMISNKIELFAKVEYLLSKKFGNVDDISKVINFVHTDYYNEEMGQNLKRRFLSFKKLMLPDKISYIKLFTNKIEKKLSDNSGNRKINIDPGYISASKLILASTKNYYHRIYVGRGIYAEVTLYYEDNSFRYFGWTYPDYRTKEYINFFNEVRKKYMKQLTND